MRRAGAGVVLSLLVFVWVGGPATSLEAPVRSGPITSGPTVGSGVPVPSAVASAPIGTHPALLGEAPSPSPGPARIVIPRLDVAAPVVAVSVGSGGQLAVPPTTSEAAWYAGGPVPGEAGSAVIAAHVDYNGRPGVFFQLDQLTVGDQIIVIDAVGSSHTFVVRSRGEYAKTTLPTAQIFSRAGPPTLTLVTCGGEFRPALHSYADNIVVQATPIAA